MRNVAGATVFANSSPTSPRVIAHRKENGSVELTLADTNGVPMAEVTITEFRWKILLEGLAKI